MNFGAPKYKYLNTKFHEKCLAAVCLGLNFPYEMKKPQYPGMF